MLRVNQLVGFGASDFAPGPPKAFTFGGASPDNLSVIQSTTTPVTRTATISFWQNLDVYVGGVATAVCFGDIDEGTLVFSDSSDSTINVVDESITTGFGLFGGTVVEDVWAHWVVRIDTTQASTANRVRVYKNGNGVSLTNIFPAQNDPLKMFKNALPFTLGRDPSDASTRFKGSLAYIDIVDGLSLDPTSFGVVNGSNWEPIPYVGSYGTHGFGLNGTLGFATSGGKAYTLTTAGSVTLTAPPTSTPIGGP